MNNIEAEISVLGSALLSAEAYAEVMATVKREDFIQERHRDIFDAMARLQGKCMDVLTLADTLEAAKKLDAIGGIAYLTELTIKTASAVNIRQYIGIIQRKRIFRELKDAAERIALAAGNEDEDALAIAEKAVFDISAKDDKTDLKPIGIDASIALGEYMSKDLKNRVPTGFSSLDTLLGGGLCRKTLCILAARPSMGKTALAMNIARNAANAGKTVAVFSLEQSRDELLLRLAAAQGRAELRAARANVLGEDANRAIDAAGELSNSDIFIDEYSQTSVQDIRSKLTRHKLRRPLDLVIIDYLQIMGFKGKAENQNLKLGEITRSLKSIAKDMDVPILLLSQLNREVERRSDKKPTLADLRESGSIEQDADVVMMLYREHVYAPTDDNEHDADLDIKKNRNGEVKSIALYWEGRYFKFTSREWRRGEESHG